MTGPGILCSSSPSCGNTSLIGRAGLGIDIFTIDSGRTEDICIQNLNSVRSLKCKHIYLAPGMSKKNFNFFVVSISFMHQQY